MKAPKFSIIIPALNEEKFLPKLLDSLSNQSYTQFEVIVVDGKSKDATVEVANSYKSKVPGLSVLVSDTRGLPVQRNLGASKATGEWLVFVDADSILFPSFIARIDAYINAQSPDWFTTWCAPDSSDVHDAIFTLLTNIYWESTKIIKRPVAPGPLTCLRASVFTAVNGYDETQAYNEDVEFGLRLSNSGYRLEFLRETLYVWSMRRIRREGKMKVMNQYIISMIPILLFKRPFKTMPGYVMGGHMYKKKKNHSLQSNVIKTYEKTLKKLKKEIGY